MALMRLDRIARPAPNVGRVCLPHLNAPTLTPPDTQATVVGWGRLGSQESDPHSNVLQAVTVPVLGDEQCQYETGLPLYSDQVLCPKYDFYTNILAFYVFVYLHKIWVI